MTNNTKPQFKIGDKVYIHSLKTQGKLYAFARDMGKTAKVEIITNFNKDTGERTTKLVTVQVSDLSPYREKKSRNNTTRKPLEIKIKYFNEKCKVEKIKQGDWIDLRAAETVEMSKGAFMLIPLGVAMELPKGFEAHVVPRSSTFKNFGVIETNSMGVIDESYKGDDDQWFFPAYALRDTKINEGERICQFRIMRKMPEVNLVEVEQLGNENRGGHGSTGTK